MLQNHLFLINEIAYIHAILNAYIHAILNAFIHAILNAYIQSLQFLFINRNLYLLLLHPKSYLCQLTQVFSLTYPYLVTILHQLIQLFPLTYLFLALTFPTQFQIFCIPNLLLLIPLYPLLKMFRFLLASMTGDLGIRRYVP